MTASPRRHPDGGSLYWRGVFARAEAEIVPGSWDVTGLRGTGSFDWTVKDVFLPERRTMPQIGIPLENQWARWPGLTYQLPVQCWVGPHHSAVITGIARAGLDALIELAGASSRAAARPGCSATARRCRMRSDGRTRSSMPAAPTAAR
jgi:indole-3-acetate monooxygenase